jgi:hypothetical protein
MYYNPLIKDKLTSFISDDNNLEVLSHNLKLGSISFVDGENIIDVFYTGKHSFNDYGEFEVNGWCFNVYFEITSEDEDFIKSNENFIIEHIIQGDCFE